MIDKYLDEAKQRNRMTSDNALAKRLGVTRASVSKWRKGYSVSQEQLAKIARLCGERPEKVMAEYELQKEHSPEVQAMWKRIQATAATVVFSAGIIGSALLDSAKQYILC